MSLITKRNLNIQKKIEMIPKSNFVVLNGKEIPKGIERRQPPEIKPRYFKSHLPSTRQ